MRNAENIVKLNYYGWIFKICTYNNGENSESKKRWLTLRSKWLTGKLPWDQSILDHYSPAHLLTAWKMDEVRRSWICRCQNWKKRVNYCRVRVRKPCTKQKWTSQEGKLGCIRVSQKKERMGETTHHSGRTFSEYSGAGETWLRAQIIAANNFVNK